MIQIRRKFKIGDKVSYTNDYGVNWGERTIIGTEDITYSESGNGYYIDPTDTPWFAIPEEKLHPVTVEETPEKSGCLIRQGHACDIMQEGKTCDDCEFDNE